MKSQKWCFPDMGWWGNGEMLANSKKPCSSAYYAEDKTETKRN